MIILQPSAQYSSLKHGSNKILCVQVCVTMCLNNNNVAARLHLDVQWVLKSLQYITLNYFTPFC